MTDHSNKMSVGFTVVQSDSDIGKQFSAPDGKMIIKQVLGMLYAGTATTRILSGATSGDILKQLGKIIVGLHGNNVLLMGTAVNGKPVNTLTTKARQGQVAGEIARSKDNFAYADELSFILIDNDGGRKTRDALCGLWPPFKDVAMLSFPSSSSAVTLNGVPAKGGGEHSYVVLRGRRHKEVLRRLLELCATHGLARIMITKNGIMLLRGPVDASVWGPERVIYAGTPHVVAPVEQGLREPQLWQGDVLNAERFISETAKLVDQAELKRVIDAMKAEKQDEADRNAEEWGRNHVKAAVAKQTAARETHAKPAAAKETVRKRVEAQVKRMVDKVKRANRVEGSTWDVREQEVLEADFVITLSDGRQITVREICADPARYDENHCADPIEGPEYGASTATILLNGENEPWIYSHAHGASTDYKLVVRELIDPSHRFAMMTHEERLAEASGRGRFPKPGTSGYAEESTRCGEDAKLLIRAAVAAGADETTRDKLKEALEFMAGIKPSAFNRQWKQAEDARRKFDGEDAAAERENVDDNDVRPVVPAPMWASPRAAFAAQIDSLLAKVQADEPPMRNSEGRLLKIVEQSIPGMHELRDDDDDNTSDEAEAGPDGPTPLPAPPLPRLHVRDADEVAMLVEQHVRLMGWLKGGGTMEVALEPPFCHALNKLEGRSAMPVARGITTMPVVSMDEKGHATLRMPIGLDRETGVIFRIPEELRSAMPKDAPTRKEAREAYQWLRDNWLADVCTDEQGKATLISMAMTIIQRYDFTERPDYMMNGSKPGTGKTTAVNMVSAATLGHRPAATAWSTSPEERRKAMFAILRSGAALVVFDNLKRGSEIHDATVEKVQTSRRYSDRKLGESEQLEGDACTVIAWTGNKIAAKADSASRNLVVTFATEYVRPSERRVRRDDVVGWTLKHRGKVLGCLYTLLLSERGLTPQMQAPTRFRKWWRVIARPIELAAEGRVSFADAMADSEANDSEELAVENLVRVFYAEFGEQPFRAAAVALLLEWVYWARSQPNHAAVGIEPSYGVDQLKHDLVEATTGVAPEHWNAVELGKRLRLIADLVARIDGVGEARLTGRRDRTGVMEWRVEVLSRAAAESPETSAAE